MPDQKLALLGSEMAFSDHGQSFVPKDRQYEQCYLVSRVKQSSLIITREVRDLILKMLAEGKNFIQINESTVMLNTISGIDPLPLKSKEHNKLIAEMRASFSQDK